MFFIFKKKTVDASIKNAVAQQISSYLHKMQVKCAAYLSNKEKKLNPTQKKLILMFFSIMMGTFFIYLILSGIADNVPSELPTRQPILIPAIDTSTLHTPMP